MAAPKRPLSAYMLYAASVRDTVRLENSDATLGDIGKLIGARWKALGAEGTAVWQGRAAEEKEAYEVSLARFLASGGVLPDKGGSTSHSHASGETVIPVVRVRRLLKSLDLEMGTIASEAAFLITSATELFLQLLASDAVEVLRGSAGGKRKTLTSLDITRAIAGNPAMAFLRPDFPLPTPSQILASRQPKAPVTTGDGEMGDGAAGGDGPDAQAPQPPRGAIFVALERQAALAAELATKAGGVSSRWRGEGGASPLRASSDRDKGDEEEEGEEVGEEQEAVKKSGKAKSKGSSGTQRKRPTTGKRGGGAGRGASIEREGKEEQDEAEEEGQFHSAPSARGKSGSKRGGAGNPLDKFVVRMTSADEAKTFWSESFAKGELKDISEGNPTESTKVRARKGKGGKKSKSGRGSRSWGDEEEEGGGGEEEGVVDLGALRKSFGVAPRRPARGETSLKRGGKGSGTIKSANALEEDEREDADEEEDEEDEDGDGEEVNADDEDGDVADGDVGDSGDDLDGRVEDGLEEEEGEEEEEGSTHVTVLPPEAPSQPPSSKRKLNK